MSRMQSAAACKEKFVTTFWRILAGLCRGHADIQKLVGESCVPELHRLEQVSAEGNIGTLAEECLEALRDNKIVFKRVSEARRATTTEKRAAALEKRKKDLEALEKNTKKWLTDIETMKDESIVCVICREGWGYFWPFSIAIRLTILPDNVRLTWITHI